MQHKLTTHKPSQNGAIRPKFFQILYSLFLKTSILGNDKILGGREKSYYKSKAEITDEKKAFEHSHARYIRFNKHPLPVLFTICTTFCNIITGVFFFKAKSMSQL